MLYEVITVLGAAGSALPILELGPDDADGHQGVELAASQPDPHESIITAGRSEDRNNFV